VTADRRYENGESGDYSKDIFNLHSFPLSCSTWHLPNAFQCTERVVLNYPWSRQRGTLLVNSGANLCADAAFGVHEVLMEAARQVSEFLSEFPALKPPG
jgi:hypothetical protein